MSNIDVVGGHLGDGEGERGEIDGAAPATGNGAPAEPAVITVCPDGPLLVRGSVRIVDGTGTVIPQHRPTIALCRCGRSRIAPLCDGTHKLLRSRDLPR